MSEPPPPQDTQDTIKARSKNTSSFFISSSYSYRTSVFMDLVRNIGLEPIKARDLKPVTVPICLSQLRE